MRQITVLTSLKKDNALKNLFNRFCCGTEKLYYRIVRNKKRFLKKEQRLNMIKEARGKNVIGHEAVLLSLFRGLDDLGVPYVYNPGIDHVRGDVILAWLGRDAVRCVEKLTALKKAGKIGKIICLPTVTGNQSDVTLKDFLEKDEFDFYCAASEWFGNEIAKDLSPDCRRKIETIPTGVRFYPENKNKPVSRKCLYYCKRYTADRFHRSVDPRVIEMCRKYKIECQVIEYGKYLLKEWEEALKTADFVIFSVFTETQGLAFAEA